MRDKISLVTGASRGLGRSMALHLARRGARVIGTYRSNRAEADSLVAAIENEGGAAAMLQLDVADSSSFPAFADDVRRILNDQFGTDRVHHLVHNAGIGIRAPVLETSEQQFDELIAIHLKAPVFLTRALSAMIADEGRILLISSGLARFTIPGNGVYAAAKGGAEVLTRYLAKELGPRQIRVNIVAPGAIETDFGGGAVRDVEAVNKMVSEATALGRPGKPDEIGAAVAALLDEEFSWANGTRIELSGGQSL
jgi:NAD(P)-dependent dehydrogenase (short-subunit alcohol dehydrogenase family)